MNTGSMHENEVFNEMSTLNMSEEEGLDLLNKQQSSGGSMRSDATTGQAKNRFGIIVLGMHRSGTSALARVLSMLGCDLPKTLLPANKNNETGYWESGSVVSLNNEILDSAGSTWRDLRAVDRGWFSSPKVDEFRQKASRILDEEVGVSHLFVLKDPRICRLAPFWLDVLEQNGISPCIVLPIRHPLEVASSSSRMKGLDPALASLLWLRHVLDAELFSRGRLRCFTSYDRMLDDWKQVAMHASETFGFSWPRYHALAGEISAFLSQQHRHHSEAKAAFIGDPSVAFWLRETYRIFDGWAASGERAEDYAVLDRIRAEFDSAAPTLLALAEAGERNAKAVTQLRTQQEATQRELEQASKQTSEQAEELCRVREELAAERETLMLARQEMERMALSQEATQRELEQASKQASEQAEELCRVREELAAERETLMLARPEMERMALSQEATQRELEQASKQASEQAEELCRVREELAAERETLMLGRQEMERMASSFVSLEQEQRISEKTLESLKARFEALVKEQQATKADQVDDSVDVREQRARLARLEADLSRARQDITIARKQLSREQEVGRWLCKTAALLATVGSSWQQLAPAKLRRAWLLKQLEQDGLFHSGEYLASNPDVAQSGMDPLFHFVRHGILEGRSLPLSEPEGNKRR